VKRADPHRALCRALIAYYPDLEITEMKSDGWASATFVGGRHVLICAERDVPGIEDAEFTLPGHLVADIQPRHEDGLLIIEALTIEVD
jgi:hypothetical protein